MGADTFIAFYGIKLAISRTDEDTLDALETLRNLDYTRGNMVCMWSGAA